MRAAAFALAPARIAAAASRRGSARSKPRRWRPRVWLKPAARGASGFPRRDGRFWRAEPNADAQSAPPADYVPQSAALRRLRVLAGARGGWFSPAELRAAERLERDHRLAQLQGRVTADWGAPPMERTARGAGSGMMGPEAAMDARTRLAAMRARIGAEASDFLADVFWSELGIEEAERRRQWPPRSGKVALKLILSALSSDGAQAAASA